MVSIIKAMGFEKAVVVGRSGGAIIGLELAPKPEVIDFLIVHEPPVIELLPGPDLQRWRTFVDKIYRRLTRRMAGCSSRIYEITDKRSQYSISSQSQ